jgi:hypothetical protein
MKKLFVWSFLICFIFSSFAHNSVQSIKIEKHKTEKVVFEVGVISNEIMPALIKTAFVAVIDVGKKQSDIAKEADYKFATLQEASYNYNYHWYRNKTETYRYPKDIKA